MWAFKSPVGEGPHLRGLPRASILLEDETPLSAHELRMDDDVYKNRQDQSVTSLHIPLTGPNRSFQGLPASGPRLDDHAMDPANQRRTGRAPSIEYVVVPAGPNGAADILAGDDITESAAHRYLLARDLVGGYAKDLGYETADDALAAVSASHRGADLEDVTYDRLVRLLGGCSAVGPEAPGAILVDDYVTTTHGHRHRPPGPGHR